jgi:hypothetical protein
LVPFSLLEVLGHVRLARPADGTNLNMSPSIADPEAAVAPSRIHPIKGGPNRVTDGFAESGPNSSRHPADGANQPEGFIRPPEWVDSSGAVAASSPSTCHTVSCSNPQNHATRSNPTTALASTARVRNQLTYRMMAS